MDKRRSSILKPQKPRNPLSDLDFAEPDEDVPVISKAVNNRRVSFASRSLVKEYARDAETNALNMNSTYEEQINRSDSTHSSERCDVENVAPGVLYVTQKISKNAISNTVEIENQLLDKENLFHVKSNKTTATNNKTILGDCSMELTQTIMDDMELTDTLPTNEIFNGAPKLLPKNQTYNKTIVSNESMDCTSAIEPNFILNEIKVIETNVKATHNIHICDKSKILDATNVADLSMELTQQVPVDYPNVLFKTDSNKTILKNESMKMTQMIPNIDLEALKDNVGKMMDANLEYTEAISTYQVKLVNQTPFSSNCNAKLRNEVDKECTQQLHTKNLKLANKYNIPEVTNKSKLINESMELTMEIPHQEKKLPERSNQYNQTQTHDMSMEFIQQLPTKGPKVKNKSKIINESMELTRGIPCQDIKLPGRSNQYNKTQTNDISMEFTQQLPSEGPKVTNKSKIMNETVELTRGIPCQDLKLPGRSNQYNKTQTHDMSMEFTQQLPSEGPKVTNKSKIINESMELTRGIPCQDIKLPGRSNQYNKTQMNDMSMEFTQQLLPEGPTVTNKSKIINETMELTRGIPCQDIKLPGRSNQYNKTQTNDMSMEFTQQLPSEGPKVTKKSKIINESMELTQGIPCQDLKLPGRSNQYNKTQTHDMSMEFTQQLPSEGPKVTNKSKIINESMELTRRIPCQDIKLPGRSNQYNKTQTNDMSMEFTQQLLPEGPTVTNKSKIINETMELTRGIPCQDLKLPGRSNQCNKTQTNDMSMEFTQQLPSEGPKVTKKSKIINESMELTRGIPCQDLKLPGRSNQYNKTHTHDMSMEFTQQLPSEGPKVTNKSKIINESMELTRGIPYQDIKLPGRSNQYNKTQMNDMSMEFTQQLLPEGPTVTNKSKIINETMELTRGIPCQDLKLPGRSNQYNKTQTNDMSMGFTQQLLPEGPTVTNKSKIINETMELTRGIPCQDQKLPGRSDQHNKTQTNDMSMEFTQQLPSEGPKVTIKSVIVKKNALPVEVSLLNLNKTYITDVKKSANKQTPSTDSDSSEKNVNQVLPNCSVMQATITEPLKETLNLKLDGTFNVNKSEAVTNCENAYYGAKDLVENILLPYEDACTKKHEPLSTQITDKTAVEENKKQIKTKIDKKICQKNGGSVTTNTTDKNICPKKEENTKTNKRLPKRILNSPLAMQTRSKIICMETQNSQRTNKTTEEPKCDEIQNDTHKKKKSKAKKKELFEEVKPKNDNLTKLQIVEKSSKVDQNLLEAVQELNIENPQVKPCHLNNIPISRLRTPQSSFHMNLTPFTPSNDDTQHLINYNIGSAHASVAKSDKKNTFIVNDDKSLKRQSNENVNSNKPSKRALWDNGTLHSSDPNEISIDTTIDEIERFSNEICQLPSDNSYSSNNDNYLLKIKKIWEEFTKQNYLENNPDDFQQQQKIHNEEIRQLLKIRKEQSEEIIRAISEPFKAPTIVIEPPSPDLTSNSCSDNSESVEMPFSPVKETVTEVLSIKQKILEKEESCDGYWNIISLKDDACEFTTLFKTIRVVVDFNKENGIVDETDVQYSISDESNRIAVLAHRVFRKLLSEENIEAAIGERYEILSLLDYVYLNMDKILCFLKDMKKLNRYDLTIDENFRAHFKIINLRLNFLWHISVDVSDLDNMSKDCITAVAEIGILKENVIEMCINNCPKGIEFLKCFFGNIIEYVNLLTKQKTN